MNYQLVSYDDTTRVAIIQVDGCPSQTTLTVPLAYTNDVERADLYDSAAGAVIAELQRAAGAGEAPITDGIPAEGLTSLQVLELKGLEYINFGGKLYTIIKQKVWAINTLAISNGTPMTTQSILTLLSYSDTLEKALKTGSLTTAKYVLDQLTGALPAYVDVGTYAKGKIDDFMRPPG